MPEIAIAETPEVSAPIEATEVETPEVSTDQETPEVSIEATGKLDDGRQFAGKLRDQYKKWSTSQDPNEVEAAKHFKELFFRDKALRDKFPGGLKDVEALKASYEGLGTPEEIQEVRAAAETLNEIDTEWMAGDPAFIDKLVTLNPESFKKLAPVALTKFAQVDPEGYQRLVSPILSATLDQARMGSQLYLISREVQRGDKDEALRLIGQIEQWMGKLDETAKSVPQPPQKNDELDQRTAQLEEREDRMFAQSLATEFNPWRDEQIKSALNKLTKGQRIDPERLEIFTDRVRLELTKLLPTDYQNNWARLYAKGDKEALIKFAKSPVEQNVSKAVAKIHALLFPGVKPKPPSSQPAPTNGAKPVEQGWIKIAARPKPEEIDRGRNRTTDEMIFQGKAILRSGKKVTWDRV